MLLSVELIVKTNMACCETSLYTWTQLDINPFFFNSSNDM